ncbi:hypothetical protein B0H14DRAFT_3492789 [Mycena olivaceomarginata]|nr:hypothetical protein B0H14DRAFT_3492789 [Mycena olivaceomarginata]
MRSTLGDLTACTVHTSITTACKYAHIKHVVAVLEPIWQKQSEEALGHQFWPSKGEGRANWSTSHFGYSTNKVRAVMYSSFAGYVCIFKASSMKQADGVWATDTEVNTKGPDTNGWKVNTAMKNPNDGVLWLCMHVPTAVWDAFLAAVVGDLLSPSFPQNLVQREREMQA